MFDLFGMVSSVWFVVLQVLLWYHFSSFLESSLGFSLPNR